MTETQNKRNYYRRPKQKNTADAPKMPAKRRPQAQRKPRQMPKAPLLPLKIIPLGGVGEIGKNMTVLEYGSDIVVLDCGMTFPDGELLGVDFVIPDTTYLQKNRDKIRGVVITHAHEDHIGAIPYFLRDFEVPIYCTALTEGIVRLRLTEHKNIKKADLIVKKAGDKFKLGVFDFELINVNHSVPDAVALAIGTPQGKLLFTGDFKIDSTPVDGEMTDLTRIGELGREGVKLLMMDSTNAERDGLAMSESRVAASFEREFKDCKKRIIISCFASNVHRIQKIIETAEKSGRYVAVSGRSIENILKVGASLGYIRADKKTIIDLQSVKKYPDDKLCIITTGSQGEPMSALYRMAYSSHKVIDVTPQDKILIAASPIPGNEKAVYQMINELIRKGAEVVYERLAEMHVSGHACREELKMVLSLAKPQYFMPVHGEYKHLKANAALGMQCGVTEKNIFLTELGRVLEINGKNVAFKGTVPAGRVLIDGYGVGDVGNAVLKERKMLADDGVIIISAAVNMKARMLASNPVIASRGFVFVKEADELMTELDKITVSAITDALRDKHCSVRMMRENIVSLMSTFLNKKTKRSPVVIPMIDEIN